MLAFRARSRKNFGFSPANEHKKIRRGSLKLPKNSSADDSVSRLAFSRFRIGSDTLIVIGSLNRKLLQSHRVRKSTNGFAPRAVSPIKPLLFLRLMKETFHSIIYVPITVEIGYFFHLTRGESLSQVPVSIAKFAFFLREIQIGNVKSTHSFCLSKRFLFLATGRADSRSLRAELE